MILRRLVLLTACAAVVSAQDRIVFSRVFPGSVPESFEASVDREGRVIYTEPDEEPVEFQLDGKETAQRFDQAEALDFFAGNLASDRKKVASSGSKVLRYEADGGVKGEAAFDYSEDEVVRDLAGWFVKLAETQQHLFELERVVRFDRLGINQTLILLENAFEHERIIAPERFVPILTKITLQKNVVHIARARAAGLLERIAARKS